jgi:hypothetical protein
MMAKINWDKAKKISLGFAQDREEKLQKKLEYYDNKDYEKRLKNGEIEKPKLTFNLTPYDQSVLDGLKKPKQTVRKRSTKEKIIKQHKKKGCKTVKTKAGRTWIVDEFGCEVLKKEE